MSYKGRSASVEDMLNWVDIYFPYGREFDSSKLFFIGSKEYCVPGFGRVNGFLKVCYWHVYQSGTKGNNWEFEGFCISESQKDMQDRFISVEVVRNANFFADLMKATWRFLAARLKEAKEQKDVDVLKNARWELFEFEEEVIRVFFHHVGTGEAVWTEHVDPHTYVEWMRSMYKMAGLEGEMNDDLL